MAVSIYVVSAICGNFWQESGVNPGIWEGLQVQSWTSLRHGYGLGQWTNTGGNTEGRLYQVHKYLSDKGLSDDDGNGQLDFLIAENYWTPKDGYRKYNTLTEFLSSDSTDLAELTHYYNYCWEGIRDSSWDARVTYAQKCYDYIRDHENDSVIWISGNRYLSEAERLNNAVCVYKKLNGYNPDGGGGGGSDPNPPSTKGGLNISIVKAIMTRKTLDDRRILI